MSAHRHSIDMTPGPLTAASVAGRWLMITVAVILLTALVLLLQTMPGIQDVLAHSGHDAGKQSQIVPEQRIELSLGRSESYDYDPPQPGSYQLPALKAAAGGEVLDAAGKTRQLYELFDERITVLSFIYTRCGDPNGCPLATGLLYKLLFISRQDAVIADNLQLISLSFDPAHDTPQVMADYANSVTTQNDGDSDRAGWQFLTTRSAADLEPILAAYGQTVDRKQDATDPFGPYYHQLKLFLIDGQQQIRNIYSLGFLDPRLVLTDIRTLLLEQQHQ